MYIQAIMFKVCQLNVSWEANNYQGDATPWAIAPTAQRTRAFHLARQAFVNNPDSVDYASPALVKAIETIQRQDADIICIQEFQIYTKWGEESTDWLVNTALNNQYLQCAISVTSGNFYPPIASIVLIRKSILIDFLPLDKLQSDASQMNTIRPAFNKGRAIAGVIATLKLPIGGTRKFMVLSSHSEHGRDWDAMYTQSYLTHFYTAYGNHMPMELIWAGDFNQDISWGKALLFGQKRVFKVPSRIYMNTTHFGRKYDWVFATSIQGGNPTLNSIIDVPSDHHLVVTMTSSRYSDRTNIFQ